MTDQKKTLELLLRHNLYAFTRKTFQVVNPGKPFRSNWHLHTIAWHLEKVESGDIPRQMILLPPRHLKSICASVAFPAWLLGRDPTLNIVCVSYSKDLAAKHAQDFRSVIDSAWYRDLFPNMRIDRRKRNTQMEIVTTRNGGRLSTSVEGTLTGRGGDVIIIDDPIKPDATMSEAERVAVNEWYRRTLYSRLNSKRDGRIVIVMQRLHEDDLVGSLLEEEPEQWDVLRIPATASEPMTYRIGDAPDDVYHRAIGEVIDPRREDAAELERIQHRLGSINFTAQYQQEPQPFEGNMVKREWFRTCENPPDRNQLDGIVQSWDTANAAGELNDYSVCTTWGVSGEAYYLLDVFREKLDYPSLRSKAIELAHRYYADVIVVELAGSGQSLRQDLHESVAAFSTGITPRGDKEMRLAAQSALIEQGRVYLPAQAVWLDEFVKEVLVFPGGRHDDQVDSLALFLKYMRRPGALSLPIKRRKARQRRRQRRLVTYGPAPTLL